MNGHVAEAESTLATLDRTFAEQPADSVPKVILGIWRSALDIRLGTFVNVDDLWQRSRNILGATPASLAMWQYTFAGPASFLSGRRDESRRAFDRAVELADQPGSEIVYAISLKNAAFFAWLANDTELLDTYAGRLAAVHAPNIVNGTRHFIESVLGEQPAKAPIGRELLYTRAFAAVVAASRELDAAERQCAFRSALDAAVEDGQPWLNALVHLAYGLAFPDKREAAFTLARTYAARVGFATFGEHVDATIAGSIPDAWSGLRRFVRHSQPRIALELLSRIVVVDDRRITLTRRESELLLALAFAHGARDRQTLAAMLWPDLDTTSAQNTVRVLVNRLRTKLGDAGLIRATPAGYQLQERAAIDLIAIENASASGNVESLDPAVRERLSRSHERPAQWMLVSEWLAPYLLRYELAVDRYRVRAAVAARTMGRHDEAAKWEAVRALEDDADFDA